jgi:hypothetical protein
VLGDRQLQGACGAITTNFNFYIGWASPQSGYFYFGKKSPYTASRKTNPVLPDSVWIRRKCFAAQNRVVMPWTKSRKLDFDHNITTLIHPLPTLRRGNNVVEERSQLQLLFLYHFSSKDAQSLILILPSTCPISEGHLLPHTPISYCTRYAIFVVGNDD